MTTAYKDYRYNTAEAAHTHGYLLRPLLSMLGPPDGAVLDLGCGNGALARELLARGYNVYGVDASATGIEIARAAAPGRFHVADIASGALPPELAAKRFEVVVCTEVVEHLYDPRGLIGFARSILPRGGRIVLSTPYHGYLKNVVLAVTGRFDAHFTVLWDGGHIKFFSRRTLEHMLRELDFDVEDFAGAGRIPLLWKSMLLKARAV